MIKTIVVQQTLPVRVLLRGRKCLLRNTQTGLLRERGSKGFISYQLLTVY